MPSKTDHDGYTSIGNNSFKRRISREDMEKLMSTPKPAAPVVPVAPAIQAEPPPPLPVEPALPEESQVVATVKPDTPPAEPETKGEPEAPAPDEPVPTETPEPPTSHTDEEPTAVLDNRELAEDTDAEPVDPVDSIATANAISFDAIAAHIETLPKPYGQDDRKALVARRRAFGAKVQLWLRTAQISQAQAAQQLGFVNRGVFNNLIGGLKPWRAATLKDLSILLNKSAEDMRKAAKMKRNT